jgi:hypothetical protein
LITSEHHRALQEGRGKKERNRGKKEIDYAFLEIVIYKLYCPYYYWLMKMEGDGYIN